MFVCRATSTYCKKTRSRRGSRVTSRAADTTSPRASAHKASLSSSLVICTGTGDAGSTGTATASACVSAEPPAVAPDTSTIVVLAGSNERELTWYFYYLVTVVVVHHSWARNNKNPGPDLGRAHDAPRGRRGDGRSRAIMMHSSSSVRP